MFLSMFHFLLSVVVALFVVSTLLQVILKLVTTRNILSLQQPPSQDQLKFSFWLAITESKNSSLASDDVKCPYCEVCRTKVNEGQFFSGNLN